MVAWQRLAEIVGEYVHQGSKLYIEGKLQTSSWEDKTSGEKKYRTEILAREIVLLGSGAGSDRDRDATPRRASSAPTHPEVLAPEPEDVPF